MGGTQLRAVCGRYALEHMSMEVSVLSGDFKSTVIHREESGG